MDIEALKSLRERVLAASGPEAELDIGVMLACDDKLRYRLCTPNYTASIDVALALVERAMPEWKCWGIEVAPGAWGIEAYVSKNDVESGHRFVSQSAKTSPLAILAALLSAVIAQQEQGAA